jgi:hypothetical protein
MDRTPEERITTAAAIWASLVALAQYSVGFFGWKAMVLTLTAGMVGAVLAGRFCWRDL